MSHQRFTLPELEQKLGALREGALYQLGRRDYERLFGESSAAIERVRKLARSHGCVASFADDAILFRKARMDERRREGIRQLILTLTAAQEQIQGLWIEEEVAFDGRSELPAETKSGQISDEAKEGLGLAKLALNVAINNLEDVLARS